MTRPVSSRQIRRAEQQLRAAGHHGVKVDGRLTAAEKRTLATVQGAVGVKPTGQLTPTTRRELARLAAWTQGHSDFTPGEKSKAIANAERRLAALGYQTGKVDGILDARSAKALESFKKDQFDLAPNGRLDHDTAVDLKAARASRSTTPQTAAQRAESILLGKAAFHDEANGTDVFRDGDDVNDPNDTWRDSNRHRVAARELARNHTVEKKVVAGLGPADRAAYQSARDALKKQRDPIAVLALQKLLFEGKLSGSLGQQLGAVANGSAPLHPSVNRGQLLADLVQECATPTAISQGPIGSCGSTTVALDLALRDPAEYARLAIGVASPSGTVAMRGGLNLVRPPGTELDDQSGRSTVQRMLGSAMYEISNGDKVYGGLGDVNGSPYTAMRTLLTQVYGRPFETAWFQTPDQNAAALRSVDEMLGAGQRPIVGVKWGDSAHYLAVTGHGSDERGGYVTLINPWGREERMSEADFLARAQGLLFDPAVVSQANRDAMWPYGPIA